MKKIVITYLIVLLYAFTLNAQNETIVSLTYPRHEIGIEYGLGFQPILNTYNHPTNPVALFPFYPGYWNPDNWIAFSDRADDHKTQNISSFSLFYLCDITSKHAVGVSANACFLRSEIKSYVREGIIYKGIDTYLSLMPKYRFTYWQKSVCSLYLGVALGITFGIQGKELNQWYNECIVAGLAHNGSPLEDRFWVNPAFQLTVFGVRLGGEHSAANIELGFGNEGIGKVGFSYRF